MPDRTPKGTSRGAKTRKTTGPVLVYRQAPHADYLVFTSLDRAIEIDRLHRAIETSTIWGEFRKSIGPEEYASLYADYFEKPDPDEDPEDIDPDTLEPADDAPFDSECVPGFSDGDYPPWLAPEIDLHVPEEILGQFAKRKDTMLNGSYYHIDAENREGIVRALREAGFEVEERQDLKFW